MNLSSIGNLRYSAAEHVAYISYLRGPVAFIRFRFIGDDGNDLRYDLNSNAFGIYTKKTR